METVEEYINLPYEIVVRPLTKEEGGGFFVYYKDFIGVMGDGETPEEAIEDVQEAFKAFLKDAIKNNDEIALPTIGVSMK